METLTSPLTSPRTSLSANAAEYIPPSLQKKKKKTKENRAGPRKRSRKKKVKEPTESCDSSEFDFDTSDLTEQRSIMSGSTKGQNRRLDDASIHEGEYMDWFGSLICLDNTTSSLLSDVLFSNPPTSTTAQDPGSSEWLALQAEWIVSKQQSLIDIEYDAEAAERKKWSEWAMYASEMERRRRMLILDEMDKAELRERQRRQKWAASAIERERNERVSEQFLANLTSTNWFNETISTYLRDYDVVCPYYKLGCREVCRKTDIERHMKGCKYAIELASALNKELLVANYEVVCPNSVLGCQYIGHKQALAQHLDHSCEYKGMTRQQEHEARQLLKEFVISECEEERVRRVKDYDSDHSGPKPPPQQPAADTTPHSEHILHSHAPKEELGGDEDGVPGDVAVGGRSGSGSAKSAKDAEKLGRKASLQRFMETQMETVVRGLHDEVLALWHRLQRQQQHRRQGEQAIVEILRKSVKRLWPFATLEVFGSWATGLPGSGSDIDLVVCFNDECHALPTITGVVPLLQGLANFLEKDVMEVIRIKKVLLHTRVPLIKGEARTYIDPVTGDAVSSDTEGAEELKVSVDISIDGPEHSGLATTAVIETVLRTLPGIGPVSTLLKEYLKFNGLCDAYTGGMPSYGVVLLVLLLFLRRHQATHLLNSHTHAAILPKSLELPSSTTQVTESPGSPNASVDRPSSRPHSSSDMDAASSASTAVSSSLFVSPKSTPKRVRRQSEGQVHSRTVPVPSTTRLYYSGGGNTSATWTSVESQKDFGRRVAAKLLSPIGSETTVAPPYTAQGLPSSPFSTSENGDIPVSSSDNSDLNSSIDQLGSPILGVVVVEFLGFYGDALECGRHGFSVRDGGFRFEVQGSGPDGAPAHPQAAHPIVIEDPVNVMNNVAKNCYNAASVQRAFVEANERFKNAVTRYSGRAGSALAVGRSSSGGFIREIFGLGADRSDSSLGEEPAAEIRTTVSYDKYEIISDVKTPNGLKMSGEKQPEDITASDTLVQQTATRRNSGNSDNTSSGPEDDRISRNYRDAEYKRALNDMLLLRLFNKSSNDTSAPSISQGKEEGGEDDDILSAQIRRKSL